MDETKPIKPFSNLKAFLLVALVLYFFISIGRINQRFGSVNQTKEIRVGEVKIKAVSANVSIPEYPETAGGQANSVIDKSPTSWRYGSTGKDPAASLTLELSEQVPIGEVDIIFRESRHASVFTIYLKEGDSWITVKDVLGNEDQSIAVIIDPSKVISTREVKISFFGTSVGDGLIGVAEVKIFKKKL